MAKFSIDELHRELEATDETYVRRKLSLGGFAPGQRKHVREWLTERELKRARAQVADSLAISARNVFWTMIAALGGLVAASTGVIVFLAKVGT